MSEHFGWNFIGEGKAGLSTPGGDLGGPCSEVTAQVEVVESIVAASSEDHSSSGSSTAKTGGDSSSASGGVSVSPPEATSSSGRVGGGASATESVAVPGVKAVPEGTGDSGTSFTNDGTAVLTRSTESSGHEVSVLGQQTNVYPGWTPASHEAEFRSNPMFSGACAKRSAICPDAHAFADRHSRLGERSCMLAR